MVKKIIFGFINSNNACLETKRIISFDWFENLDGPISLSVMEFCKVSKNVSEEAYLGQFKKVILFQVKPIVNKNFLEKGW